MTTPFTEEEKLTCVRRELTQRQRVYPRLIEQRRMTQEQATRETQLMEAIIADYEERASGERLL